MIFVKRSRNVRGYTLVEIGLVLIIASLMMGLVLKQSGLFDTVKTADTIKLIQDISSAAQQFRQRYGYLPGDLPSAQNNFASLSAACNMTTATQPKIGNGALDIAQESVCAIEELARAELIRATGFTKIDVKYACGQTNCVDLLGATYARTVSASYPLMPTSIRNVIALYNLPCEAAMEIELKYDDNNLATGNYRASVSSCVPGTTNDPVPIFLVPLV
jgi:type II secretory pathway pseudopilin PulG